MSALLGAALSASLLLTGAPAAVAGSAPADSYTLTSSTYSVKPWSYPNITASCGAGYHARANVVPSIDMPGFYEYKAIVDTHGSYIFNNGTVPSGPQVGTDSNGYPEYQAFVISLGNHSWISSHDGWFTWTCDAN